MYEAEKIKVVVPLSASVLDRSYYQSTFDSLNGENYLIGHLQVTIGVPIDRFVDLMAILFKEDQFFFESTPVWGILFGYIDEKFSDNAKVLLFFSQSTTLLVTHLKKGSCS